MDKAVFIQGVREHPDDENHRLIYADFLEERGDLRGQLIRLQCELPKLDVMDPKWLKVRNRINNLLDEHADRWLAPLRDLGANRLSRRCFQGGLLERVAINATNVPASIAALCELEPALAYMDIHIDSHEGVPALARADIPPQIRAMDLSRNLLDDEAIRMLINASWWPHLTELNMQNNGLTDDTAQILLKAPLQNLKTLRLGGNPFSHGAALGGFAALPQLKTLELDRTRVDRDGIRQIARTPNSIEHLNLASTRGGDGAASELCHQASTLASIRSLNLRGIRMTLEGVVLFAGDHVMQDIEVLDLRSNIRDPSRYGYGRSETPAHPEFQRLREKYGDKVLL